VGSTTQDDVQELKRRKWHASNNTWHTAKKSAKSDSTPAAVKLPSKAALSSNFFTCLRPTNTDTEITAAENTRYIAGKRGSQKLGRKAPILMASVVGHVRLPSDLTTSKESTISEIHEMEPVS
jgi:hypothetical protein